MKDLDGKKICMGTLFSQEYFFRVPEYQRPFSWEPDNFEDLIDDLLSANHQQEYFLGTIVLHKRNEQNDYDIVDGQQRITSIMVLLACLRDIAGNQEYKKGIQDKIVQPRNVVDGIQEKKRLTVRDWKIFKDLIITENGTKESRKIHDLPEPECRYYNAISIFNERLKGLKENEIEDIINFLSQKCVIISLATSTFDDAFRLFTIVNDRGKQLRRIDILKSLNLAPDVITNESIRTRVAQEWEDHEKDLTGSTFESIFHLIRLIFLKDKPQGDLLKEFDDRIFSKGHILKGETFFNCAFDYVLLYKKIFIEKDIMSSTDENHNKFKSLIHIMNREFVASEWRACILYFAKKFKGANIYPFCLLIEKVYLSHWVKAMRKDERYSDYSRILVLISNSKKSEDVLVNISYDNTSKNDKGLPTIIYDSNEIIKSAKNNNFYNVGYCKYFLLRLELLTAEHDSLHEYSPASIEHVLPQTPNATGYWAEKHDLSNINEYVNKLGNLVLLSKGKNSSAKNFDFEKKKEKYLKDRVSDYPRSIQVLSFSEWTKEVIEERTSEAAANILNDL